MVAPIVEGRADVVFGSRFSRPSGRWRPSLHRAGNAVLTAASKAFTHLRLTDMECGYKAFRHEVIRVIRIEENGFGFEPEIAAKVARLGCRIAEVPVSYHPRTYAEGKKIGWRDGIAALRCIVQYGVS